MNTRHWTLRGFAGGLACSWLAAVAAEPLRDPMQAPAAAMPSASAGTPRDAADDTPRHIVAIGNTRHVVEHGRRLSVGDLLGASRIERIDDDAVWLRDAQGLRRAPLYPGITRRPVDAAAPASSALPSPAPKRSTMKDLPR